MPFKNVHLLYRDKALLSRLWVSFHMYVTIYSFPQQE